MLPFYGVLFPLIITKSVLSFSVFILKIKIPGNLPKHQNSVSIVVICWCSGFSLGCTQVIWELFILPGHTSDQLEPRMWGPGICSL